MSELVRSAGLKVSREAVQEKLNELAGSYSNPDEVRRAYLQNAEMMRQIESQVLEQQAVDWVLGQARVTEKPSSFAGASGAVGGSAGEVRAGRDLMRVGKQEF